MKTTKFACLVSFSGGGGFDRGEVGFGARTRGPETPASGDQTDLGPATQIGMWTNETEANPKTDSWGEMWDGEDNQWQGGWT